ncbi:MAG: inositol monophosphatase [Betaproteobacteria bacterium]|nr:inositol monophosphatase [Betaproteobacteria bacterium]
MRPNLDPVVNIAIKAARRAAAIINQAANKLELLNIETKAPNDFVTEVDRAAEVAIIDILREAFPEHGILAEESGQTGAGDGRKAEYVWMVDPLDGTTNFIHGFPQYAVSIALTRKGVPEHAVIFDPVSNELFTASRGRGAYMNDRRIRVSRCQRLADALLGTGFPFRQFAHIDTYLAMFRELAQKSVGLRRAGAAALDLAYVASGRLDGFWEIGLSPWDMAAGALLIQEAGGFVAGFDGEGGYFKSGNIVAGTPKVFTELLLTVQSCWNTHT